MKVGKGEKDMKQVFERLKVMKRNRIITGIIFAILGVLFIIWPGMFLNMICRIIGVALLAAGVISVVMYFIESKKGFAVPILLFVGAIVAVIGIWFITNPEILVELAPRIIGVIFVIQGISMLLSVYTLTGQHYSGWWVSLIFAAVTLVIGVVLIVKAFSVAAIFARLIGVVFVFNGVSEIWTVSHIKTKDDRPIDVEGEIIDEDKEII